MIFNKEKINFIKQNEVKTLSARRMMINRDFDMTTKYQIYEILQNTEYDSIGTFRFFKRLNKTNVFIDDNNKEISIKDDEINISKLIVDIGYVIRTPYQLNQYISFPYNNIEIDFDGRIKYESSIE